MPRASSLPVWIHKRDGRLVPFEADKISQSLFAASESLGRPDAFTARELTDGVLHFLCAELNGAIPQTGQVAEMTVKIVRELGQAAIAQAYADFSTKRSQRPRREEKEAAIESSRVSAGRGRQPRLPSAAAMASLDNVSLVREVAATYLTNFSLEEIFTRDIAAAHREGLIILASLETPFEIQGGTLQGWSKPLSLALEDARQSVGQFIVLDGPEFGEASGIALPEVTPGDWVQDLFFGLRTQGLRAVVNLNAAVPPPWAQSLAAGPLFDPNSSRLSAENCTENADEFLQALACRANWGRVQWHLREQDWTPKNAARTNRLARHLLQRAPITIAFDRTPRAISLSEGLDRRNSSLLISVGLNLPGLSRMLGEEAKPELFLQKLGSLARLAITAAVQKRRFITRYRRKQPAFLVDRARLAVVPVGLESVTRRYTGQSILLGNAGADFACRIIRGLGETLREEGSIYNLEAVLDSAPSHEAWPVMGRLTHFEVAGQGSQLTLPNIEEVAGLTTWNKDLTPAQQIQAGGLLHALVGAGTQWVLLPPGFSLKEEDMVAVLRTAWKETQANRIRFVSLDHEGRQLTAPWEGSERDLLLTGPAGTPTMRASES